VSAADSIWQIKALKAINETDLLIALLLSPGRHLHQPRNAGGLCPSRRMGIHRLKRIGKLESERGVVESGKSVPVKTSHALCEPTPIFLQLPQFILKDGHNGARNSVKETHYIRYH